jgi:hypothetical protein
MLPLVGGKVAREQVGQCGLARAIGANHGVDVAQPQIQRDLIHSRQAAKALGQATGGHQDLALSHGPPPWLFAAKSPVDQAQNALGRKDDQAPR